MENAVTTFWFSTISFTRDVSSPLISACFLNILYVLFAMNDATKSDTGVIHTTTMAMIQLIDSMKHSVPTIVITPVNNCVNPIRSPSENWSTSAMILLTMSPCVCESTYESGRLPSFSYAFVLTSLTTLYVIMLLSTFMTHCATAVITTTITSFANIPLSPVKSTFPGPTTLSIACPMMIGAYSVSTTDMAAHMRDRTTRNLYLLIYFNILSIVFLFTDLFPLSLLMRQFLLRKL